MVFEPPSNAAVGSAGIKQFYSPLVCAKFRISKYNSQRLLNHIHKHEDRKMVRSTRSVNAPLGKP